MSQLCNPDTILDFLLEYVCIVRHLKPVTIALELDEKKVNELTGKFIVEQGDAILDLTVRNCFEILNAKVGGRLEPWKKKIKRKIKWDVCFWTMDDIKSESHLMSLK